MKLTAGQLRRIIKEELQHLTEQGDEPGAEWQQQFFKRFVDSPASDYFRRRYNWAADDDTTSEAREEWDDSQGVRATSDGVYTFHKHHHEQVIFEKWGPHVIFNLNPGYVMSQDDAEELLSDLGNQPDYVDDAFEEVYAFSPSGIGIMSGPDDADIDWPYGQKLEAHKSISDQLGPRD